VQLDPPTVLPFTPEDRNPQPIWGKTLEKIMALNTNGKLITDAEATKAWEDGVRIKLHDGGGLWLDVRGKRSASWVFKFTDGVADEVGLGSYKKVKLAQARVWRQWCNDRLGEKKNPKEEFQRMRAAKIAAANAPKAETVYQLAENHIAAIAPDLKTNQAKWIRSLHRDLIGKLADMYPGEVTREALLEMLGPYTKKHPVAAGRVRQRLCAVLSWAKANDHIVTEGWVNPAAWEDNLEHREELKTDHEKTSRVALPYAEVGAFLRDIKGYGGPVTVQCLEWMILSASRVSEACQADWSQLDLDNDCWVIPADVMKMRLAHRVPLTDRHHDILEAMIPPGETEYPLSGPIFRMYDGQGPSDATLRVAMHSVNDEIDLHGFRTSFSTWAHKQKDTVTRSSGEQMLVMLFDRDHIKECLAHVPEARKGVEGDYNREDYLDFRRPIMDAWAAYCAVVQETNVVPLPRRRRRAA
jgi:integrase